MTPVSRTAIVGSLLMMLPGLAYGFSALSQPLGASYHWKPLAIATVFGINIFCNGLGALAGGPVADRFGSRYLAMAGAILIGLGTIMVGVAIPVFGFVGFFVGFGAITGFGNGLVAISAISAVLKNRTSGFGFGGALAVFGYGLGAVVYGAILHALPIYKELARSASAVVKAAESYGDGTTRGVTMPSEQIVNLSSIFIGSGTIFIIVGIALALNLPAKAERQRDDRRSFGFFETIWSRQAWLSWFSWLIAAIAGVSIFGQALPILADVTHRPTSELSGLLTLYALAACIGRISLGTLADFYGFRRMLGTAFALLAATLFAIGIVHVPIVSIAAFGFAYLLFGGIAGLLIGWTAKSFGTEHVGANWGWINSAFGAAGLFGPWFVGMFHQITGSYAGALLPIGFLAAGAVALPAFMRENYDAPDGRLDRLRVVERESSVLR